MDQANVVECGQVKSPAASMSGYPHSYYEPFMMPPQPNEVITRINATSMMPPCSGLHESGAVSPSSNGGTGSQAGGNNGSIHPRPPVCGKLNAESGLAETYCLPYILLHHYADLRWSSSRPGSLKQIPLSAAHKIGLLISH
jgi:hypothetical protein